MKILRTSFPWTPRTLDEYHPDFDFLARAIIAQSSYLINLFLYCLLFYYFVVRRVFSSLYFYVVFGSVVAIFYVIGFFLLPFIMGGSIEKLRDTFQHYKEELSLLLVLPSSEAFEEEIERASLWADQELMGNAEDEIISEDGTTKGDNFLMFSRSAIVREWLILLGKGAFIGFLLSLVSIPFVPLFAFLFSSFFATVFNLNLLYSLLFGFLTSHFFLTASLLLVLNNRYMKKVSSLVEKPKTMVLKRKDVINWYEGYIICSECGTVNNLHAEYCVLCGHPLSSTNEQS